MTKTLQVVIAWAEQTKLVPTGRTIVRDLNYFPEFKTDWEGRACMWIAKGDAADVEKARKWAVTESKTVLTFPLSEKNPLEAARNLAVKNQLAA